MRLNEAEEDHSQSQIPRTHTDLTYATTSPWITSPIRIPRMRETNKSSHSSETVDYSKNKVQPGDRRIPDNEEKEDKGDKIKQSLLFVAPLSHRSIANKSHYEAGKIAERSSEKKTVYQVHSDTSFKKPSYMFLEE